MATAVKKNNSFNKVFEWIKVGCQMANGVILHMRENFQLFFTTGNVE